MALLLLVACSSKPSGRPFAKLGDSEIPAVCAELVASRDAIAKLPGMTKVRCGYSALAAAGSPDHTTPDAMRTVCTQHLAECLAEPPPPDPFDCPSTIREQLAKCGDLTVEEVLACNDETRSLVDAAAKEEPCAVELDPQDPLGTIARWTAKTRGAACARFTEKCKR